MTVPTSTGPAPRRDALGLGAGAAVLYGLLAQRSCYGDGVLLLLRNDGAAMRADTHGGYAWLLLASRTLVESVGGTLYAAAMLLSVLGGAAGAALLHRAGARLGLGRADALLCAALAASTPAALFFATVVELHGPFLAFAGLAWLAFAGWLRAPSARSALLLGAACGLAYFGHATAVLLPLLFLLLQRTLSRALGRSRQPLVATHVALVTLVPALLITGGSWLLRQFGAAVDPASAAAFLVRIGGHTGFDATALPGTLLHDWLLPYLPLSVLCAAGLRRQQARAATGTLLLAVAGGLALTWVLVGHGTERGAYLLPLAWPAALISAAVLPRRLLWAALVAGAAIGIAAVRAHDRPERSASYARGLRELFGRQDVLLLLGHPDDLEAHFVHLPRQAYVPLVDAAAFDPETTRRNLAQFDRLLREALQAHDAVVLTAGAEQWMDLPIARQRTGSGELLDHLRREYRLEPVAAHGFAGRRVLLRDETPTGR